MRQGVKRPRNAKNLEGRNEGSCGVNESVSCSDVHQFRRRKSVAYRDTLRTTSAKKLEIVHTPVPSHVKPILSAAQRSAKRISRKARDFAKKVKNVRVIAKPIQVVEITPRLEKKAGIVTMPESPPFPYSRTTFFNLLARHNLVDIYHPKRNKYIYGDIELNDLGLSPGTVQKMRDYVEAENYRDNFAFEESGNGLSFPKLARKSTNILKPFTENCGKRLKQSKLVPGTLSSRSLAFQAQVENLQDEEIISVPDCEGKKARKGGAARSISTSTVVTTVASSGLETANKSQQKRKKTSTKRQPATEKLIGKQCSNLRKSVVLEHAKRNIVGETKVIMLDDDLVVKASCSTDSDVWVTSQKKLLFKEKDYAPFSSICHVGSIEMEADNFGLKTKAVSTRSASMESYSLFALPRRRRQRSCSKGLPKRFKKQPTFSLIEQSFFSRARSLSNGKSNNWCTLLRPRNSKEVLGNTAAVEEVQNWMLGWKKHLGKVMAKEQNLGEKAKEKQPRKKQLSDSDDEFVIDDDDNLCNTLVLSGPLGCGKSAMIEAIAEELNMAIMVSATNEKRNGASLRAKFDGALDSHRFASPAYDIRKLLSMKTSIPLNEEKKEKPSCTVILIDDADVSFTEDTLFWASLKSMCSEAKIPVIISCQDCRYVESKLSKEPAVDYLVVKMNRLSTIEVVQYVRASFAGLLSYDICQSSLERVVKFLKCDLRACINFVQFYGPQLPDLDLMETTSNSRNKIDYQFLSSLDASTSQLRINELLQREFSCENLSNDVGRGEGLESVKTIQSAYSSPYFYSLSEIATDILPVLNIMDKTSREEAVSSRRVLHHFDRFFIDPHGDIRRALRNYSFPLL